MQKPDFTTPSASPFAILSQDSEAGEQAGLCDTLPRQAVELSALDARVRDLLLCVYQVALPADSPRARPRFTETSGIVAAHPL